MITKTGKTILAAQQKQDAENRGTAMAAGGAAGMLGGLTVAQLGAIPTVLAIKDRLGAKDMTDAESSRLIKDMSKGRNIPVDPSFMGGLDSHYNPATGRIRANKNSHVLAHELGHATSIFGSSKASQIGRGIFTHGLGSKFLAPVSEGIKGARDAYNEKMGITPEEGEGTGLNVATNIGRLSSAGMLAEEGQASLRGLRAIGKIQGKAGVMRALGTFLPAYGTYAGRALGSHVVSPYIGKMIGEHMAEQELETANK